MGYLLILVLAELILNFIVFSFSLLDADSKMNISYMIYSIITLVIYIICYFL